MKTHHEEARPHGRVVVFGANGWIAGYVLPLLKSRFAEVNVPPPSVRADDTEAVERYLSTLDPTGLGVSHVLSLIGRTHGPGCGTIDYLEQPGKLVDNVRDNLYAPVALALACKERGIHLTYLGTGCIFDNEAPDQHKMYGEEDCPDFFGSSYSIVKGFTDRLMHAGLLSDTVLNVRIRMPIVSEVHPRNFITKIVSYSKVCSVPNSMSVLETLMPLMVDMMVRGVTGTINLTNPGHITHNTILEMYKKYVDPSFTWCNFSRAEQDTILASKRSNNVLDTTRLLSMYPDVPDIATAVQTCLKKMAS